MPLIIMTPEQMTLLCRPLHVCGCDKMIRPRCEQRGCDGEAEFSLWMDRFGSRPLHFRFLCRLCCTFLTEPKPWPGIDRPKHADEDWRPSISHHINMNRVNVAAETRMREKPAAPTVNRRGYTPAQQRCLMALRQISSRAPSENGNG